MKTSTAIARFVSVALVLAGCENAPAASPPSPSGPPAVVALARTSADAPTAELAAGLALEVGHLLSRNGEVVVRTVSSPTALPGASFAETADRLAVDRVIWVDVAGTPEQPVVSYVTETSGGDLESGRSLEALTGRDAAAPTPAPAEYALFLRALGRASAKGVDEAERVAAFEELPPELGAYAPAVAELGHAYLDLAGVLPGTGPYYALAEKTLRRAFELDPLYPPARYLLASCLTKLGRSEESVTLLQEGLASRSAIPRYHDELGYVLRYAGLMEPSMASYRRAQKLDSSLENLVSTQDQITKSLIYLGRLDEALASHEKMEGFLGRLGKSPDAKEWFYRGVIHLYAGEPDQAVESFRRGEALDSTSVWTTFGRAYAGIARKDRAAVARVLDALERSVVVDGERHYRLVHFAAFLGEPERAVRHLEASIQAGFFNAPYMTSDPLTLSVRTDPGFVRALSTAQDRHAAFKTRVEAGTPR